MAFEKKIPGKKFTIKAEEWNALIDAALANLGKQTQSATEQDARTLPPFLTAKVRNSSGAGKDQFDAVALRTPITSPTDNLPEWKRQLTYDGYTAASGDLTSLPSKIGVLLKPALDGSITDACVAGIVKVRVNMVDAAHRYCDLVAGQTYLQSASTGSATIVWVESGTGVKWAEVMLGGASLALTGTITLAGVNAGSGDSTSSTSVSTIQIDLASGGQIVTVSAGVRKIVWQPASATHAGVVSTGTQEFAGAKEFLDDVWIEGTGSTLGFALTVSAGQSLFSKHASFTGYDNSTACTLPFALRVVPSSQTEPNGVLYEGGGADPGYISVWAGIVSGIGGSYKVSFLDAQVGGGSRGNETGTKLIFSAAGICSIENSTGTAYFQCDGNAGIGTDAVPVSRFGMTFIGGLATASGSGGFTGSSP